MCVYVCVQIISDLVDEDSFLQSRSESMAASVVGAVHFFPKFSQSLAPMFGYVVVGPLRNCRALPPPPPKSRQGGGRGDGGRGDGGRDVVDLIRVPPFPPPMPGHLLSCVQHGVVSNGVACNEDTGDGDGQWDQVCALGAAGWGALPVCRLPGGALARCVHPSR
jgi:hypothetical protein